MAPGGGGAAERSCSQVMPGDSWRYEPIIEMGRLAWCPYFYALVFAPHRCGLTDSGQGASSLCWLGLQEDDNCEIANIWHQ